MNSNDKQTEREVTSVNNNVFFKSQPRRELLVLVFVLCILVYFPVFSFLGTIPMRIWDESRLAINAIEMTQSGKLLATTYNNEPDLWNTKPPLMIWFQAISINIFGINEFAVRLPSAIAAFLTCVVLFLLTFKISGSNWLPFISVLILITSQGYVSIHGIRTADYDSLLTLMTCSYAFCIYYFIFTGNKKYYNAFFIFLVLAVLTKGIAGLLIAPGILIFLIFDKRLLQLLKMKETWAGLFYFILIVCAYYMVEELINPGYLQHVLYNEITGRYLSVVEKHAHPFNFYINNLIDSRYTYFLPIALAGMIFNNFSNNRALSHFSGFCSVVAISFLLVLSFSTSKIAHYDLPVYPFLAVISGIFIFNIFIVIRDFDESGKYFRYNVLPLIFLCFIFITPYQIIFNKWVKPTESEHDNYFYGTCYALKKVLKNPLGITDLKIVHEGDNQHIEFYRHMLTDNGIKSEYADFSNLKNNDVLIVGEDKILDQIPDTFQYYVIETVEYAKIVQIKSTKRYTDLLEKYRINPIQNPCYNQCNPWVLEKVQSESGQVAALSVFSDFETGYDCNDFTQHINSLNAYSGTRSIYIDKDHNFSASFKCVFTHLSGYDFIEIHGKTWSENSSSTALAMITFRDQKQTYHTNDTRLFRDRIDPGTWLDFEAYFNLRKEGIPERADLIIFFYNNEDNQLYLDDIRITFFKSGN